MPPSHLPEHKIGVFVRFASSISAAAPETAARKRLPQRRSRCEGSAIGKPHGTIGKMRGDTIGKLEITYAVRRMSRPLMPM